VDLHGYVFVTSGSQAFSSCRYGCTCSDIGIYLRHFQFPGIQRLKARVDLLGYTVCILLTSGSQAFSSGCHGGLARICFRHFRIPGIQKGTGGLARICLRFFLFQAFSTCRQSGLARICLHHFRFPAFSTGRQSGLARISFSLPVPRHKAIEGTDGLARINTFTSGWQLARGPPKASLSLPFLFQCTVFHMQVRSPAHLTRILCKILWAF
jgi:hypothetical protein